MSYVDIPLTKLLLAFGLLLVAVAISRRFDLGLERELLFGGLRGAAQLLAIGYVLLLLFAHATPAWVALALIVMLLVAAWTSASRVSRDAIIGRRALIPRALGAIACGSAVALVPVFAFIVAPSPWFDPRYIVPISGMIIANAMNVVALVSERIFSLSPADHAQIEQLLALGASPRQALAPHARAALRASLIPTINGLLTVGLVALPGMMTGQIVSGTSPDHAVRYQLVILYQLVAVAAVSGAVSVTFARGVLFTPREQLKSRDHRDS